jgi:hypothetical protein
MGMNDAFMNTEDAPLAMIWSQFGGCSGRWQLHWRCLDHMAMPNNHSIIYLFIFIQNIYHHHLPENANHFIGDLDLMRMVPRIVQRDGCQEQKSSEKMIQTTSILHIIGCYDVL